MEAFDAAGEPAVINVLAQDGKTLIGVGGTALEMVDRAGNSVDRSEIRILNAEGEELEPTESSFAHVNILKKAKLDDYLSLLVKAVYWLHPADGSDTGLLSDHLRDGRLFTFPFSFRRGIETSDAYIVGNQEDVFLVVGDCATLEFVKFSQPVYLDVPEEQEISVDEIDFTLM